MSDISIECYECGAVYKIEEDYNSGSTRVVKVVPHKCEQEYGSCSCCGEAVEFGKQDEHVCPDEKGKE